jgi:acetolactate synthase-1/2/3 large subunit
MATLSPTSRSPLVRMLQASGADLAALARCTVDPSTLIDDGFDYSRVVVRKPWGYEYLMFQNDAVAIWILRLLPGASTSLHCHQKKITSLAVLSGEACCRSIDDSVTRKAGEGLVIGAGVFHQTTAISPEGVFLMEIEAPVNKRDLVRLSDPYGRSGLGYESAEHMTVNTANYNRLSFLGESIFYNTRKRFKDTSVRLVRSEGPALLTHLTTASSTDLVGVLRGRVLDGTGELSATAGEFVDLALPGLTVEQGFEAVVVSYCDRTARVADVIVGHLRSRDIGAFFFSPGTTNAHLVDAVARESEGAFIAQTSDSAAAHAAVAHAKLTGRPCCCILSAGAAAASALPAVADAWTDSAPVLFLCAQTRLTKFPKQNRRLRQLANKELDGVALARPISKLARLVSDPLKLRIELDRALALTIAGRAGPVWLDLPIDLLGQAVDEGLLESSTLPRPSRRVCPSAAQISETLALLANSQRPLLLLGHGVRAAGAQGDALQLIQRHRIPVVTTRRGADLIGADEPLLCGRPGTYGRAGANQLIRDCDLLICIGARLELPLVGRNHTDFATTARKIVVDLDAAELGKSTVSPDLAIRADAGAFVRALLKVATGNIPTTSAVWLAHCSVLRDKPTTSPGQPLLNSGGVDPFWAAAALSASAPSDAVIVAEGGSPLDYVMREWKFGRSQRLVAATGLEGDGFGIAAAVGASLSCPNRRIICLCEAGAFLRSTPELATVLNHRLPVTIVIFSAADDLRVRETQARYFGERHVAAAPQHELAAVMTQCLAARAVPVISVTGPAKLEAALANAFPKQGPVICVLPVADEVRPAGGPMYEVRSDGRWEVTPRDPHQSPSS